MGFSGREVEAKQGWVLTADRSSMCLFYSTPTGVKRRSWQPINNWHRRIFSSPLVVNGVVYFGSADGFLYALE